MVDFMTKYALAIIWFLSISAAFATPPIYGPLETQNNFSEITSNGTQATAETNLFGHTITLGGNFSTSGANSLTFTTTGTTNVTLPTSGTLLTTAGASSTYAPIDSPTFTGTVTIPTITLSGGTIDGTAIGNTTPSTGTFTSVNAQGAGTFGTTANSGGATFLINENLSSTNGTISEIVAKTGTGHSASIVDDQGASSSVAIFQNGGMDTGGLDIIANAGVIDIASNTVFSGTSFSVLGDALFFSTAPTIASGFGTSPSISASNGTAAFSIHIGTGGTSSTGTLNMPTATDGWVCDAADITTQSASVFYTKETGDSASTVVLTQYNDTATATAWVAGDTVLVKCSAY